MKSKKQKRNLYKTNTNSEMEYSKIIKIAIGVILVLGIVYFITALATGEIKLGKEKEPEEEETAIQYEEIMVGQILNRSESEYYVLLFNFTDNFASYYLSLKDTYIQNEGSLPVYIIDLEKHVNKDYVLQDGEYLVEKPVRLVDFRATNPTIVRIKDRKVEERISGRDNILKFFEEK